MLRGSSGITSVTLPFGSAGLAAAAGAMVAAGAAGFAASAGFGASAGLAAAGAVVAAGAAGFAASEPALGAAGGVGVQAISRPTTSSRVVIRRSRVLRCARRQEAPGQ